MSNLRRKKEAEDVRLAGRKAALSGKSIETNPYPVYDMNNYQWRRGYIEQAKDLASGEAAWSAMSLYDELLVAVRSCPQNDYDTRMLVETIIIPIIERALADERAATIEECKRLAALHRNIDVEASIDKLPRKHSALADALAQAEKQGRNLMYSVFWDAARCDYGVTEVCDAEGILQKVAAQARREQREDDCAAVDAGYAKWEKDRLCHESGCSCVTEYIKLAIQGQSHETQKT